MYFHEKKKKSWIYKEENKLNQYPIEIRMIISSIFSW